MRNVIALFGINASGKTTIGERLAAMLGGAPFARSSQLLMDRLGGSRETLECMPAKKKEETLRTALLAEFERHTSALNVVADMHLVITIRDEQVRREHVWSAEYAPHLRAAFFLDCPPSVVLARRIKDLESSGRRRDLDIEGIAEDSRVNLAAFQACVRPHVPIATIVENLNGPDQVAQFIQTVVGLHQPVKTRPVAASERV